jgi:hypothetical protein
MLLEGFAVQTEHDQEEEEGWKRVMRRVSERLVRRVSKYPARQRRATSDHVPGQRVGGVGMISLERKIRFVWLVVKVCNNSVQQILQSCYLGRRCTLHPSKLNCHHRESEHLQQRRFK